MARYFDPTSSDDKARLHHSVTSHAELERVAKKAERDVIRKLSDVKRTGRRRGSGRTVQGAITGSLGPASQGYLAIGYPFDADAGDAPSGEELEALKDTIAGVISHRLRYLDTDEHVTSRSVGSKSESRESFDPDWPNEWREPIEPWLQDTYAV